MSEKKCDKKGFSEAQDALCQARSLIAIAGDAYMDIQHENIGRLLDVLGGKIDVAINFFDENVSCGKEARNGDERK